MTKALVEVLTKTYRGKFVNECIDEIKKLAGKRLVNVMDPEYNLSPIDNEPERLNIKTGRDGKIKKFTIG